MQRIKPCPYCGGEVEMVKLPRTKDDKIEGDIFRISCYTCKALVARGQGFPIETLSEAEERIHQWYVEAANKKPGLFAVNSHHHGSWKYEG